MMKFNKENITTLSWKNTLEVYFKSYDPHIGDKEECFYAIEFEDDLDPTSVIKDWYNENVKSIINALNYIDLCYTKYHDDGMDIYYDYINKSVCNEEYLKTLSKEELDIINEIYENCICYNIYAIDVRYYDDKSNHYSYEVSVD